MTDLGFTGGGNGTHQVYISGLTDHRLKDADIVDHLVELVEKKAAEVEAARLAAAETALHVTDLAMRICGGAAFGRHLTVERHFRDARAGSIMAPTTDVLYDLVAKTLLDMPLF